MKHLKTHKRKSARRRSSRRHMKGGKLCDTSNNDRNVYTVNESKKIGSTWYVYDQLGDDNIVIKKIGPASWLSKEEIENELRIAVIASDLGAGPRVIYTHVCVEPNPNPSKPSKTTGYLVMEKIHGDLVYNLHEQKRLSEDEFKEIIRQRNMYLDIFYDNGIRLSDHSGIKNIMYGTTMSHPAPRVWFIDFGFVIQDRDAEGNPIPTPAANRNYREDITNRFEAMTFK